MEASNRDKMNELTLESWLITPECRSNRGQNGAWTEAVKQLRKVYLGQSNHDPGVVLRLSISRVRVDAVEAGSPLLPEKREQIATHEIPGVVAKAAKAAEQRGYERGLEEGLTRYATGERDAAAEQRGYERGYERAECDSMAAVDAAAEAAYRKAFAEARAAIQALPSAIVLSLDETRAIWRYHVDEALAALDALDKEASAGDPPTS